MTRRIDPEPITIFMTTMAVVSASMTIVSTSVAIANYIRTHHGSLPTQMRKELVSLLAQLNDHTRHLREDLGIIEDIFRRARFQHGLTIRLGNGAYLEESDYSRFAKVSDRIICTLRIVQKLSLKLERKAAKLDWIEMGPTTNTLGETYQKLERLLGSGELTHQNSWNELRSITQDLERVIDGLRPGLGLE